MKLLFRKLGVCAVFSLATLQIHAYDLEIDGIYYNVTSLDDQTCEVTNGDKKYEGDITIPAEITFNNLKFAVTEIGNAAFKDCAFLNTVKMPNSTYAIGHEAFYNCALLESVVIPPSVTTIDSYAFFGCKSLESLLLPYSVTFIGSRTFSDCSILTDISLPNSLTTIGSEAFYNCVALEALKIPDSVTEIQHGAFAFCSALKNIELPQNLEYLDYGLFYFCTSLESLTIPGSIKNWSQYYISTYTPEFNTFAGCPLHKLNILHSTEQLCFGFSSYKSNFAEGSWDSKYANVITDLYLDRAINAAISVSYLETLELGETVKEAKLANIEDARNLISIKCHALEPPTLPTMSNYQYMFTEVYVPEEVIDVYRNDPSWEKFWKLYALSGTEETIVSVSREIVSQVSLSGYPVGKDYHGVVIGSYSDGTVEKILR